MRPVGLRCEYVENPLGVQSARPVLSWMGSDFRRGAHQVAYQVVASSDEEKLKSGDYDLWDSDKMESEKFFCIPYEGKKLHSAQRVYWKVRIWDEQGSMSQFSEPAYFEMGLLHSSDWKGRWMGFLGGLIGNGILMRYSFKVEKEPVRARAYICGIGYYELRLNGDRVGDKLLDPGATDYSKTLLYSAYDVTDGLGIGLNSVGIILGTGWAGTPRALLQLNIEFADGTRQEVYTDWGIGWCVAKGPIVYNSIYDGEDYDARLEKDGWDTPEYQDTFLIEHQRPEGWSLATIIEPPGGELVGEISTPIRCTGVTIPKHIKTLPDGRELFDVGENQSGWVRIRVKGERGAKVKLTFAEVLKPDGDLEMSYLRLARCQDSYILRGDKGIEEYAPRFTYHGFRYFTVETAGIVSIKSMQMEFIRSDLKQNAEFECSDEFLNRLVHIMWHTDACNMHSIPTDCCQRDERHGWTTDTTSRAEGSVYHFDVSSFFEKWTRDVFDTQDENGYFADTAPHRWGRRPCDPQVNTPISLPLLLYRAYGNKRVIEQNYESMKRYIEVLLKEADDLLISRTGFGEWACPAEECYPEPYGAGAVSKHVTATLVSTAYLHYSVTQLKQMAGILGHDEDALYFENLAAAIKEKYNARFFNEAASQYDMGSQSSNTLSVSLGLTPEKYREAVIRNIAENVAEHDYHLTTGNMGTKSIVETLSENGYEDLVYTIMTQKTSPSFGYMLEKGATSIWERWEADRNNNIMNSQNHPMLSACNVWFYKYLGGIRFIDDTAAYQQLLIAPTIPSQLEYAKTEMDIMAGHVSTHWKKENGSLMLNVEIPFNTSASVIIPKKFAVEGAKLYEGGSIICDYSNNASLCQGITSVESCEDRYVVEILSGSYSFLLE
ncbi:alpha-L-rhamnosidase [Ruminiclostridium cellobioparum]|uniref:alpha-L-rhamnosidase n=1 Tax=Ruminiclostridium cellobioparum TaxID=29355 RepID=UPI000480DBE5|nr:alpha-L-rhamnosidase [Ruminiclostridium cellobioparum]